jgi:hypothetical protein
MSPYLGAEDFSACWFKVKPYADTDFAILRRVLAYHAVFVYLKASEILSLNRLRSVSEDSLCQFALARVKSAENLCKMMRKFPPPD